MNHKVMASIIKRLQMYRILLLIQICLLVQDYIKQTEQLYF